jgi:hypothetical protein
MLLRVIAILWVSPESFSILRHKSGELGLHSRILNLQLVSTRTDCHIARIDLSEHIRELVTGIFKLLRESKRPSARPQRVDRRAPQI